MTRLDLRIFGLDLSLEVPRERYDAIHAQWSWCLPDASAQRTIPPISGTDVPGAVSGTVARPHLDDDEGGHLADYRLTTTVTGRAITGCAGSYFMLHAAGIADPATGRVAGLVAPSGTGKTTASRTLCSAGFGYVTDETLIFNDHGDVLPYPKPLSVILGGDAGRKSQHGPDELGFAPLPDMELQLGALIVLERVQDTTTPRLEPISVFEGLTALLPQSSGLPYITDCLEHIAQLARRSGGFHRLVYSEITEAIPVLQEAFTLPPREQDWVHVPGNWPQGKDAQSRYGHATPAEVEVEPATQDRYERGHFVDAVATVEGDEALVLVGDLPVHLQGIGAQMWTYLAASCTVADLVRFCIEANGEHPEAPRLVVEALTRLEQNGVVHRLV